MKYYRTKSDMECFKQILFQSSIKFLKNSYDFLSPPNTVSFLHNPTDAIEIKKLIMSHNPLKAVDSNSISRKILKSLIIDVSLQLTELFNLSFSLMVSRELEKTSEFIPFNKKRI